MKMRVTRASRRLSENYIELHVKNALEAWNVGMHCLAAELPVAFPGWSTLATNHGSSPSLRYNPCGKLVGRGILR
jgi:hypothetical protein